MMLQSNGLYFMLYVMPPRTAPSDVRRRGL